MWSFRMRKYNTAVAMRVNPVIAQPTAMPIMAALLKPRCSLELVPVVTSLAAMDGDGDGEGAQSIFRGEPQRAALPT
jgi:hypothetical protein